MTTFATVNSDVNLAGSYVQSADPINLAARVNAVFASLALNPLNRVTSINLAGAGDGHTFIVEITSALAANITTGTGLDPALISARCYMAADASQLLLQRSRIPNIGQPVGEEFLAGAAQGTRFMGLFVRGPGVSVVCCDGGGGSILPLSNTMWVDGGTTVPLIEQDGSIAKPFETLTQALAALSGTVRNILMTPGDYSGEADIVLPSTAGVAFSIVCMSAFYGIGAIIPDYAAKLPAISGAGFDQVLHTVNCIFDGKNVSIPGSTFRFDWTRFTGGATVAAQIVALNYSEIDGLITAGNGGGANVGVRAKNCRLNAAGTFITTVSGQVHAYFCTFNPGAINVTFAAGAGTFFVDSFSNFHFKAATETITNGVKAIIGDLTP